MTDIEADRTALLLQMYRRRFDDIDRHIRVVWQSTGSVVGVFALFALVERGTVSMDLAVSIVVLMNAWSSAQVIDASYWYNRNSVIATNIEREFLRAEDTVLIHGYFLTHRAGNAMISYLRIQLWLAGVLAALVLLFHALALASGRAPVENTAPLPYLVAGFAIVVLHLFQSRADAKYLGFLRASPGRRVILPGDGTPRHAGLELERRDGASVDDGSRPAPRRRPDDGPSQPD